MNHKTHTDLRKISSSEKREIQEPIKNVMFGKF